MTPASEYTGHALVVGTGRMARLRIPTLQAAGLHVTLTGRDFARTQQMAVALSAKAVEYQYASARIYDCVLVASASEDHLVDLQTFLPNAPVMLCEKPVATSAAEARRLTEVAAACGVELYVGFQRRFDPSVAALRDRVRDGHFGTLLHVRAADYDYRPGSRQFIAKSGGMFKDLVIHDLDWLTWTTGLTVTTVHAYGSAIISDDYRDLDDCDIATVSAVLENGTHATISASRAHPLGQDVRMEVIGTRAAASVGLTSSTPLIPVEGNTAVGTDPPPQDFIFRFAEAFRRETDHFARYATGRLTTFDGCTLNEAVNALIAAEACDTSWRSGQQVSCAQVGRTPAH